MRIVPTASGEVPDGANVCAVPVVPHSVAARRTNQIPEIRGDFAGIKNKD
jgi:hypothetical protein